jgi:hypothetical protein
MGVADLTFDASMVESALFRSSGVKPDSYQYGPATNPDPSKGFRSYPASGTGVGHDYVHVQGKGDGKESWGEGLAKKSRYADRATMIGVLVEALKHPTAMEALKKLDATPGRQEWLQGGKAVPMKGVWYGYAQDETTKRKIEKVSINMRSHGDALFISSSYPEDFQADAPAPQAATPSTVATTASGPSAPKSTLNVNAKPFVPGGKF